MVISDRTGSALEVGAASPFGEAGPDDLVKARSWHQPRLPMQHRDWLLSAARHPAAGQQLVQFEGRSDHQEAAALPMLRSGRPISRLTLPAAALTGEPCDLGASNRAELDHLVRQLAAQPLPIVLARVPVRSPSIAALGQAFAGRGWVRCTAAKASPYIDLDDTWATPALKFNAGRRSDFRRAQRHAEKLGDLSFEVHEHATPEQLDRLLDEAYAVEAQSWKGLCGSSLASNHELGDFFRRFAHAALQAGQLRLAFMRVAGQAIAMQMAVESDQRFWLLKIGYDPGYSKCAPGNLLMLHTVAYAAQRKLRSYEFLGSPEAWTAEWTTTLRSYLKVSVYPATLPGLLAVLEDSYRFVQVRWRARLARVTGLAS